MKESHLMNELTEFPGFRLEIDKQDYFGSSCRHYSGMGNITSAANCRCPNCGNLLYPAIHLSFPDEKLSKVLDWNHPSLTILFCPFCALYMEPYWLRHKSSGVEVVGGYRDGGEILQNIETPYLCREIHIKPLEADDYPVDDAKRENLLSRHRPPGVYHQIGGMPIKGVNKHLNCCDCGGDMSFMGILDYDDLNVPLYEDNHSPVALIIGDYDSLNIYVCKECSVLGLKWVLGEAR